MQLLLLFLLTLIPPSSSLDFLFNSFAPSDDLILVNDARVESRAAVLRLTNDTNQFSVGRAFYPSPVPILRRSPNASAAAAVASFATSFVFSVLPADRSSPGFGLAFVLSGSTSPADALAGQYFGLFTNATALAAAPLLAVEFDTGQNPEFNDPDGNHVGIDLNSVESAATKTAEYDTAAGPVPVDMSSGQNVRAWIEFDGGRLEFNVTVAPADAPRPSRPLLTYRNPEIRNFVSDEMFVGFSASKVTWVEEQRVLAWSFSDTGGPARELNTSNLPNFLPISSGSSFSAGAIAGISVASSVLAMLCFLLIFWLRRRNRGMDEDEAIEDWELEFWPHRFSYEAILEATDGFSKNNLLGSGGFGKVYRGILSNETEVAVKCVNKDSKQGLPEFMAEISTIGRLRHKNLVQMRGWCRRGTELMLVYDYMPNGSLNRWIFDVSEAEAAALGWGARRRVLADVAEGLCYLHHGWDQVVLHRDIKSGNVLLDAEMGARLGDFGLAKLYEQGEAPGATRVVGTLGYLAPELATARAPTAASDVYGFGVVVLEVICGRRPIETWRLAEEEEVLVEWVAGLYGKGRLREAADRRVAAAAAAEDVEAVLKLGLACCHPDPLRRPSMKEVVAMLVGEEAVAAITAGPEVSVELGGGDDPGMETPLSQRR